MKSLYTSSRLFKSLNIRTQIILAIVSLDHPTLSNISKFLGMDKERVYYHLVKMLDEGLIFIRDKSKEYFTYSVFYDDAEFLESLSPFITQLKNIISVENPNVDKQDIFRILVSTIREYMLIKSLELLLNGDTNGG